MCALKSNSKVGKFFCTSHCCIQCLAAARMSKQSHVSVNFMPLLSGELVYGGLVSVCLVSKLSLHTVGVASLMSENKYSTSQTADISYESFSCT